MAQQPNLFEQWHEAFGVRLQGSLAEDLKKASINCEMKSWTNLLTTAVVQSCESIGWVASARWNPTSRLPKAGSEYLNMDVMVFPGGETPKWPMPMGVFELENSKSDQRVAYSLWKVLCVYARFRVVFAYRQDWEQSRSLVKALEKSVIESLSIEERQSLTGDTMLVIGNRGEGETFPWGYFKFWKLNTNLGRFEKL